MLQLEDTPGFTRNNRVMTHAQHKQVRQHCDAHGFLTALLVSADLVLAQPQARFQLPVHELDRPPFLVDAHDLARRQLGQIGYQDFGMLGAHVAPLFAQHHSNVADMTQTQAGAISTYTKIYLYPTLEFAQCRMLWDDDLLRHGARHKNGLRADSTEAGVQRRCDS